MIVLEQATADAFARREIRIIPKLFLVVNSVDIDIPGNALISRPACSTSPVVSRTPVVRMDLELAATDEVKAKIDYRKKIRYQEYINGQLIDKFGGVIEHIEKGWAVKDGSVIETLRVICYSQSQLLKDFDYELIENAYLDGPATTSDIVALTPVLGHWVETVTKTSAATDVLLLENAWSPNAAGPSGFGGSIVRLPDGTTRTGGTDYLIQATPTTPMQILWVDAVEPATGVEYTLECRYVVGFVVPDSETYHTTTTPATMTPYQMIDVGTDPLDVEYGIAMIPQTNLARKATFSQSRSKPAFSYRRGSGTGAPTDYMTTWPQNAIDWNIEWEQGWAEVRNISVTDNPFIFSDNQYSVDDVMFVGAKELYWPDVSHTNNQIETKISNLYADAGLTTSLAASGVALGDYRIIGSKGDEALRQYRDNLPPNYIIYDSPSGVTKSLSMEQKATPDFVLSQVTGLKNKEVPQDIYTAVRVISLIGQGYVPINPDNVNYRGKWPDNPKYASDWLNIEHIWDGSISTYATLDYPTARIVLKSCGNSNIIERLKRINIRFEGMLTIYSIANIYCDGDTELSDSGYSQLIQPYAQYKVATGRSNNEGRFDVEIPTLSDRAIGYTHPESFILEFTTWAGCPTCKVYELEATVDIYTVGSAFLADVSPYDGTWSFVDISPVAGTAGYDSFYTYLKTVPESVLLSWMIYPQTISYYIANSIDPDIFIWLWWYHRVYTITTLPSLNPRRACEISKEYLEDFYRRAVIQEAPVVCEAQCEIGDTVQIDDPTTGESILRTIVGYRESGSWTEPMTTLELADYGA